MKKSVLCLVSGGIDSTVLLKHYLDKGWDVKALFVDHGQPMINAEGVAVRDIVGNLSLDLLDAQCDFVYDGFFGPIRNAYILCLAINIAYNQHIKNVAIGLCHGEYLDTRPEFTDRFNFMQEYCLKNPIWVLAPFSNWSSERVIRYGLKINAPLHLTVSCMETPTCGECLKCKLRKKYKIDEKSNFITSEGVTLVEDHEG